jgi:hypothetical protein
VAVEAAVLVVAGVAVAGREEALAVLAEGRERVQAKAERVALAVARPVAEKAVPAEARRVEVKAVPAEATRAQEEPVVGPRETMAIITATTQ